MRILLAVDSDGARQADYALADWSDRDYLRVALRRVAAYLDCKDQDALRTLSIAFDDTGAPVRFYADGGASLGFNVSLPSEVRRRAVAAEGTSEHAGVYAVPAGVPCSPEGFRVVDAEMVVGEEGLFYRAYHDGTGQEVVTAPAPLELLTAAARELGLG